MFVINPGDQIIDQFAVFEDDGVTKHTGLTQGGGDFVVTVWQDGAVAVLAVVVSEIGASGEYKMVYTPPTEGYWKVEVFVPYSEEYFQSLSMVGNSADLIGVKADLARILGLLHYNGILDNQTYDANDQLLTARLRIFDTASNVPALPGGNETFGLKQQYLIEAEYVGNNRSNKYTLKKVL